MLDRLADLWAAALGYAATAARFVWQYVIVPAADLFAGIAALPLPVALLAAVTGAALGVLAVVAYVAYEQRRN